MQFSGGCIAEIHSLVAADLIVEHIHTDPFSEEALRNTLGNRTFDLTIAAYGRLRRIAQILVGRPGREGLVVSGIFFSLR